MSEKREKGNGKTHFQVYSAVIVHAVLIAMLLGLSTSPIVGIALPILLGVGGYRLFDVLLSERRTPESSALSAFSQAGSWIPTIWCFTLVLFLLFFIALRTGRFDRSGLAARTSVLDYVSVDSLRVDDFPYVVLVAKQLDLLGLTGEQKQTAARQLAKMESTQLMKLSQNLQLVNQERRKQLEVSDDRTFGLFALPQNAR